MISIQVGSVTDISLNVRGMRLLIERHWPIYAQKNALNVDVWLKEIAPSPGLNSWFDRSSGQWESFRDRYFRELDTKPRELDKLFQLVRAGPVSLMCQAGGEPHSVVNALREFIRLRLPEIDDVK